MSAPALLVAPALVALVGGLVATLVQHRTAPHVAARVLLGVVVCSTAAVLWGLLLVIAAAVDPRLPASWGWCTDLLDHARVPGWLGWGASAVLVLVLGKGLRAAHARARVRSAPSSGGDFEVLPTAEPVAFAVPGRPGHIAVSDGMLAILDPDEFAVLVAHERSHLRHRHHRYVAVAEVATAGIPVLRRLATHVRYATERWADEDAARAVGDRRLVARALARAALARGGVATPGLALAGLGVGARVEALLGHAPVGPPRLSTIALATGGIAAVVTVGASTLQLHHLAELLIHACAG